MPRRPSESVREVTPALLRAWLLPPLPRDGDKDERGRVLVAGGDAEVPGGVILAAESALRSGAGKLQIATCRSVAGVVAAAVPEARVVSLTESREGAVSRRNATRLAGIAESVDVLALGPGMMDDGEAGALAARLQRLLPHTPMVLDSAALAGLPRAPGSGRRGPTIVTPHAGEMARLLDRTAEAVEKDRLGCAREAAHALDSVVVLKGHETFIVEPRGKTYRSRVGNVGLATSGSGDCLTGLIAGLLARGAGVCQAAVWGVFVHAAAGRRLSRRVGPVGFLAREIPAEIPGVLAGFR